MNPIIAVPTRTPYRYHGAFPRPCFFATSKDVPLMIVPKPLPIAKAVEFTPKYIPNARVSAIDTAMFCWFGLASIIPTA